MELEFRRRDYEAEEEACSLPHILAETHPLSAPSPPPPPSPHQVDLAFKEKDDIFDPLRESNEKMEVPLKDFEDINLTVRPLAEVAAPYSSKEWMSFKKFLMQRFPVVKMISVSSISSAILKGGKEQQYAENENLSVDPHKDELGDHKKLDEGVKVMSQQEYASRLHELKDEIIHSWHNDDRVTSLKLSIKVARLLMDTSVFQFYPTLFVLVTDVMDLLGDILWERIRQKAEFKEDGTSICSLPDNFDATSICDGAKETCNNWFCKVGSIRELLPRIYLELAILPCWRFLIDNPAKILQRLVWMMRGISDPLASAYCHLYMVPRAGKLLQQDVGCLISGINDLQHLIMRVVSAQQTAHGIALSGGRSLVSLMEPAIEYMMKRIFKNLSQKMPWDILTGLGLGSDQSDLFGDRSCISIVLHHLLNELPIEIVCQNAMDILHLIECNVDSSLDQFLNYKLLGLRLCESMPQASDAIAIVDKIIQVISKYDSLDEYLKVLDAYLDIVLQNQMDTYLSIILEKIFEQVCAEEICESALESLQSVFLKLLTHFQNLKYILSLNHFVDILDVMHGSSKNIINIQILRMAARDTCFRDPTVIHFLFEVSQALYDGEDLSNIRNDENQHSARLISRFINMVDHGLDFERNLSFLVDCRGAFGGMSELKETLVHCSNLLAIKAMQHGKNHVNFIKSCLAFSEVTIPSIPANSRQLNLYLATAEVAFLCGLFSHSDGLIDSAICCMQSIDLADGLITPNDRDACLNLICKLCSLLTLVPANFEKGFMNAPRNVFAFLNSQSWMTSKLQIRGLCALISMLAASSQNSIPSPDLHVKVISNNSLLLSDPTYSRELLLFSGVIIQKIIDIVLEEPLQDTRGNLALEACNRILSSFNACQEILTISSKLVEIAKQSLGSGNKYLISTIKSLDSRRLCLQQDARTLNRA